MSKSKILEPPIGIIISHPAIFFKEYSQEKYETEFEKLNDPKLNKVWYRVMKNVPTKDFLYIYTCYHGFIQHRTNFGGIIRNQDLKFPRPEGGIKTFKNANAIMLVGPYVKAPFEIQRKGTQGFSYVYQELW